MRVGEYKHPTYGNISFTADRLKRFADSVKNKVRGIALDIDYDHKADPTKGNEAAGWVEDAKVEGDTLQLLVDWTAPAVQKIKDKAYRYFSPEFQDEWSDSNGIVHRDVLFGGGITNRPFLKDLLPVNLSELTFAEQKNEGKGMDLSKLRTLYGLKADGSEDDQIVARAEQDRTAATTKSQPVDRTATTHAPNNAATDPQGQVNGLPFDATTATGVDDKGNMVTPGEVELSELAKKSPVMAMLLAERTATNKRLAELEQSNKINGIKVKLNEYRSGATIVAPVILDEATKVLAALPESMHAPIHAMLAEVQKLGASGTVQLGEQGRGGAQTRNVNGKSAYDQVVELVGTKRKQFSEQNGKALSEADAMLEVFDEHPDLFAAYQTESYAFQA
jgi:phage I-like protein